MHAQLHTVLSPYTRIGGKARDAREQPGTL